MSCRRLTWAPAPFVVAVCLFLHTVVVSTRADQIIVKGINFPAARIIGLEGAELRFRCADGRLRTALVDEVELIAVDRGDVFADFNHAEQLLADGEPGRAIVRYRRALRVTEEYWPELIAARSIRACDAAGQVDKATESFIRVLRGRWAGPAAAARLIPRSIPTRLDGKVLRAIEQLSAALSRDPGEAERVLLEVFRYELFRLVSDERMARASRVIATFAIPQEVRSERVYSIQLEGLRAALEEDVTEAALRGLDSAIGHCPDALLPAFLLLKGRALLRAASTREEIIRATWPFMRVAVHFPGDPLAAEGLYGAATALERVGRADKAKELLKECLSHERATAETRQLAATALARLQLGSAAGT